MKKTIQSKIFTFNLLTVSLLFILTAVAFNFLASIYFERETLQQLNTIASKAENTVRSASNPMPSDELPRDDRFSSYFNLYRALRAPSSILNADFAFIDEKNNLLLPYEDITGTMADDQTRLLTEILNQQEKKDTEEMSLTFEGAKFAVVIKNIPVYSSQRSYFPIPPVRPGTAPSTAPSTTPVPITNWKLIVYSSLDKVNQIQETITLILLLILLVSAVIVLPISSYVSRDISIPLSKLCSHIRNLAERNFSSSFSIPADNEIQELVNNINTMAEKLDSYDKSQKLFLQNASHEFRTPIMSIQCHAEGIQYGVVEGQEAARVILDETKRLTHMVEELLYLSRLDAIEDIYHFAEVNVNDLLSSCKERMVNIAQNSGIALQLALSSESLVFKGDFEKLERCLSNLMSNCIRYAEGFVLLSASKYPEGVEITLSDDGPGFDPGELDSVFERFYKGKKGNVGLGLAIAKSIIEKHQGTLTAENTSHGALYRILLPL